MSTRASRQAESERLNPDGPEDPEQDNDLRVRDVRPNYSMLQKIYTIWNLFRWSAIVIFVLVMAVNRRDEINGYYTSARCQVCATQAHSNPGTYYEFDKCTSLVTDSSSNLLKDGGWFELGLQSPVPTYVTNNSVMVVLTVGFCAFMSYYMWKFASGVLSFDFDEYSGHRYTMSDRFIFLAFLLNSFLAPPIAYAVTSLYNLSFVDECYILSYSKAYHYVSLILFNMAGACFVCSVCLASYVARRVVVTGAWLWATFFVIRFVVAARILHVGGDATALVVCILCLLGWLEIAYWGLPIFVKRYVMPSESVII